MKAIILNALKSNCVWPPHPEQAVRQLPWIIRVSSLAILLIL